MENEKFEIEIQDENEAAEDSTQLPVNFLRLGEIDHTDVKVYIKQNVYKELEDFAASDTSTELGSILIGNFSDEMGKTNVVISDYIEAKYTDASASTLTFTHETWEYVHKEHEKSYSDKKIVGWQHTHPNYGIFLSNYDMFIQENFFNLPFQVAYVIDPIQNIRGFFQWKDGKVEKLKGFYIYDDVGVQIKLEGKKKKSESESENAIATKSSKSLKITAAILSVIIAILAINLVKLSSEIKTLTEEIEQVQTVINQQSSAITSLYTDSYKENTKNDDQITFVKYEVKSGDTLSSICKDNDIDYAKNINIIKSVNGLKNESNIYAGQVLLIPAE